MNPTMMMPSDKLLLSRIPPAIASIVLEECYPYGVRVVDVFDNVRSRVVSTVRQRIWARIRTELPIYSFPDIGRMFRRDHTTVMAGVKKASTASAVS